MNPSFFYHLRNISLSLLTLLAITGLPVSTSADDDLPSIGQIESSNILDSEKKLGQAWLKQFRSSVSLYTDPAVTEFTDRLLAKLAFYIGLSGEDLSLIIVKNKDLNAFAVPGGVIGVHTGLYEYAETEAQFASVMAHELAHLSQRHYARNLETEKGRTLTNMAALLAGLVLIASNNGDAGAAAISTAQAATIDNTLRFSRLFEEEADNIGFSILKKAGYPANAMSAMFEQMQKASRFNSTPPEFLLTHPITAKRIANTKNRVLNKTTTLDDSTLDYDLIRARVLLSKAQSGQQAINFFRDEINGFSPSINASRYGLILALIKDKQYGEARKKLEDLKNSLAHSQNQHPLFIIAESDILLGENRVEESHTLIEQAINNNNNGAFIRALKTQKSALYMAERRHSEAVESLKRLSQDYPDDANIWYQLSEFSGLAGDTLTLHQSRAEFFILFANFKSAQDQLNNILKKYKNNDDAVAKAKTRLADIKVMIEDEKF